MARRETDLAEACADFLDALVHGNPGLAEMVALDLVANGLPVTELYVEVMAPALDEVGARWQAGELGVADEHLASAIVQGVMSLVGRTAFRDARRTRERVLLACVGGEGHAIGLRMIADLAEGAGFDVRDLGAAVPVSELAGIVERHAADVVGLSVTMPASAAQLREALDEVVRLHRPRLVLVGGPGVTPALREDERVRYAANAREAIAAIEEVAGPVPRAEPDP